MFVGTSPAFDLAMFSTCFIRGMAAQFNNVGKRVTDCDCQIDVGGTISTVRIKTIEKIAKRGKVCTAYPTGVQCKISLTIITNFTY